MQNTVSEPVKESEKTGGLSGHSLDKKILNMLVIGPPDAGKTYFLNEVFDSKILKATEETVGVVDFGKRNLGEEINLQIFEVGGKQNFKEIDLKLFDIVLMMINDD
jgi:GTPase SAR1 family protein